jgi:hypothetical protein
MSRLMGVLRPACSLLDPTLPFSVTALPPKAGKQVGGGNDLPSCINDAKEFTRMLRSPCEFRDISGSKYPTLVSCLKESLYYSERFGTLPHAHRTPQETIGAD